MSVTRQLAVATGASSGIGLELAKCSAENGFGLVIAADEPEISNPAICSSAKVLEVVCSLIFER